MKNFSDMFGESLRCRRIDDGFINGAPVECVNFQNSSLLSLLQWQGEILCLCLLQVMQFHTVAHELMYEVVETLLHAASSRMS